MDTALFAAHNKLVGGFNLSRERSSSPLATFERSNAALFAALTDAPSADDAVERALAIIDAAIRSVADDLTDDDVACLHAHAWWCDRNLLAKALSGALFFVLIGRTEVLGESIEDRINGSNGGSSHSLTVYQAHLLREALNSVGMTLLVAEDAVVPWDHTEAGSDTDDGDNSDDDHVDHVDSPLAPLDQADVAAPNTPPDASAFVASDPLMRAAAARSRYSGHRVSAAERVTSSALMGLLLALAAARVADASLACDTC